VEGAMVYPNWRLLDLKKPVLSFLGAEKLAKD
jgi:hypothetical protein